MPPTYLTAYDDSAAAMAALRFTRRLARAAGAKVVAAYVYPDARPIPSPYGPQTLIAFDADLTAVARETALRVVERVPDDVEAFVIAGGSVPRELDEFARQEDAALLAVGATHRGSVGRVLPGSIGERVIHGSPCPVLVVPQGQVERPVRRIAVAYDGREESRRALRAASALAGRLGASLLLIGVTDLPPGEYLPHLPDHEHDCEITQAMRAVLERAASRLLPQGFDVSIRLPVGGPGPAIVEACDDEVDLLVAGSHAHGAMHSALAGSVARHLVDHAPCARARRATSHGDRARRRRGSRRRQERFFVK